MLPTKAGVTERATGRHDPVGSPARVAAEWDERLLAITPIAASSAGEQANRKEILQ
jgi:hypothetical protein